MQANPGEIGNEVGVPQSRRSIGADGGWKPCYIAPWPYNAIEQSKAYSLGDLPTNRNAPQAKSG
jgi:hypothetical protein